MKKLAIINDLSGFGRCSLTAAISVTSAMGVQACPLPTAILSAQTGFPSYHCFDFTDQMPLIQKEWELLNAKFTGIYTGFVSNEMQIDHIMNFLQHFYTDNTFLLVDPVMGDDGCTYDMFTTSLKEKMKTLTKCADIITPNLTELCLLTDTDYESLLSIKDGDELHKTIGEIGMSYCQQGPKQIIVTGIHYKNEAQVDCISNAYITSSSDDFYYTCGPSLGGSYSGTGDLFASCIAAGIANQFPIPLIMDLAQEFLQHAIGDSVRNKVPYVEGVNFEKYLSILTQKPCEK